MYFAVLIALIIIIAVIFILKKKPLLEGLDPTVQESNEALLNLASVYNTGNATLTNLKLTGNLDAGDNQLSAKRFCANASNGWQYCWHGGRGGSDGAQDSLDLHFYQNGAWKNNPITFGPDGSVRINNTNLQVNGRNMISEHNTYNDRLTNLERSVTDLLNNAVRKDRAYAIQSQGAGRGGFLQDGGDRFGPWAGDPKARMMFVQL